MDKHLSYLVINFATVFFPIILSFDKRVQFYKSWKFIFPGLFISGLLFLFWDHLFTVYGVWTFNSEYLTGVYFLDLPLEEILFFLTVPFACVFIYECLNFYVKKDLFAPFRKPFSVLLIVFSALMVILFWDRVYTLITFSSLFAIIVYSEFVRKAKFLSRFYLAYFVSLIPFYIVNGLLTSIPIVLYNDAENCGFRVGSIPVEDHFYSLSMLLLNVLFFEYFKSRRGRA